MSVASAVIDDIQPLAFVISIFNIWFWEKFESYQGLASD